MNVSFEIPSRVSLLPHLRKTFADVLCCAAPDGAGLHRETVRDVVLILNEAVTNAIIHAHKRCAALPVAVSISTEGDLVKLKIKDRGDGFDISRIKEPALDAIHGRGIMIIRSLAEKVVYKNNTLVISYRVKNEDNK